MRRAALMLLPLLLLWGCRDVPPSPTEVTPSGPLREIRDAARNGGIAGFYFITPIAPNLSAYPGTFDGSLLPVVEICRWTGTACDGSSVARYTRTEGTGGRLIQVFPDQQLYRVDWPTVGLPAGQVYRIGVSLNGVQLGFADAKVPAAGESATQVRQQGYVPLGNSSALAIRFRMEQGVGSDGTPNERRRLALEATAERFRILSSQGLSRNELNQALAEWMRAQPVIEAAGVHDESGSVWGRFTDGRLLIVPDGFELTSTGPLLSRTVSADGPLQAPPASTRPSAGAMPRAAASASTEGARFAASAAPPPFPTELPIANQVRLLVGIPFVPASEAMYDVRDIMEAWLGEDGYRSTASRAASIEELKGVSGDAFFHITSHGGVGITRELESMYGVQTTVQVDLTGSDPDDPEQRYAGDLDAGRLIYMLSFNGVRTADGGEVLTPYYGITHRFVTEYMEFPRSLVLINACASVSRDARPFVDAVFAKGASAYMGWTRDVDEVIALRSAAFILDRLLGARLIQGTWSHRFPEHQAVPPQRPFDWESVIDYDLPPEISIDAVTGATIGGLRNPNHGEVVGPLAPSISYLYYERDDSGDELVVFEGTFGTDPGAGSRRVLLGGRELEVREWQPWGITATMPADLDGDAQVIVRGHGSNRRPLSEWRGPITYTIRDQGSLRFTLTMNLQTRMDLGLLRPLPGMEPAAHTRDAIFMHAGRLASASYEGRGSHSWSENGCSLSEQWSGAGSIPLLALAPDSDRWYHYHGRVDPALDGLTLDVAVQVFGAELTRTRRETCPNDDGTSTTSEWTSTEPVNLPPEAYDVEFLGQRIMIRMPLDAQMNILQRSRSLPMRSRVIDGPAEAELRWGPIAATPTYDRSRVH